RYSGPRTAARSLPRRPPMPHAHRPSRGSRWPTPPLEDRPPAHPAYPGPRASASAGAPGRRPRRGFTIVELLVTISIVAVLLSLLAPAIRSTIGASRGFKCTMALRAVAMDFVLYADEE